ncbi:AMP-dependent synthetase/ligase [Candidatus Magnetominusculus xianensis]|uniref:Long-chain fatty acid--CoA ligase n=1 Tax=Candidatus Magnetominusculus xianensis TaxID=1748249 RepID=A0ABR5SKQ9_9BACT|nr:AMP-dependent synthetase/ligase [Candidatus Magnetominusculus xianensis]KWT94669.1 long-chain fatty acid--CoA ligase [Candidatus Magnetominusculus xianensis]MBF0403381.1 long-chain fatty acid--CoA ligase [Nitrospirota bacterium]
MKDDIEFRTEAQVLIAMNDNEPEAVRFIAPLQGGGQIDVINVTWRDFLSYSSKAALYLSELGVRPNTKVAVYAKNRLQWPFCLMAIHACRGVFVPVYHSYTPAEVEYILTHSDSEILITELDMLSVLLKIWNRLPPIRKIILMDMKLDFTQSIADFDKLKDKIVFIDDVYADGERLLRDDPDGFTRLAAQITKDDVSTILYTSGTTGPPKGVVLTYENLYVNAGDWIDVLSPLIPETRVDLLWLPMSHIFGWGELGLGNTLGFTTYFTTPFTVLSDMPTARPTIFISVPAYWEKLYLTAKAASEDKTEQMAKLRELTGGRLRFCLSGGAGLKREVKEFFYEAGLLLIEGYGLTECSPTLTMNRKDDFDFDTVGKPFPRVELRLAADGEILAKGLNIFKEYYKDPAATKEAFDEDGWFKTGDLGEFTERGFLKIKGRKKEIIVTSGGKNISPQLIELRFKDDPYIEHIVIYGNERKYLTALVTLKQDTVSAYAKQHGITFSEFSALVINQSITALIQSRIDEVNKDLASFETIKKFYIYDGHLMPGNGFLTPSLKLRRKNIHEAFKDRLDALYSQ